MKYWLKKRKLLKIACCLVLIFVIIVFLEGNVLSNASDTDSELEHALGPRDASSAAFVLPDQDTVLQEPSEYNKVENGSNRFLLVMVVSAPSNVQARNVIRRGLKTVLENRNREIKLKAGLENRPKLNQLLFFSGLPDTIAAKQKLFDEANEYGDLIIDDLEDSYLNLTLKSLRILKWVERNSYQADFMAKMDDDFFLNVDKVLGILEGLSQREGGGKDLIGGNLRQGISPVRSPNAFFGKFYVPVDMWPGDKFPDFISGPFYVLGKRARSKILKAAMLQPLFPLEDVFITGIIGSHYLGMPLTDLSTTANFWTPVLLNLVTSSCDIQKDYVGVHFHNKQFNYMDCWKDFNDKNFVCSYWPLLTYCWFR